MKRDFLPVIFKYTGVALYSPTCARIFSHVHALYQPGSPGLQMTKKTSQASRLITAAKIVRQCNHTWNPIYDSILVMYQKLRDLGFVYRDGKIEPP